MLAIGTLIIVFQFFARWDGYWHEGTYILLILVIFSVLVVIHFLLTLIQLHYHIRKMNLMAPEIYQTPQFVIDRHPPPDYNSTQFVVQTNVIAGNVQNLYPIEPPPYNQVVQRDENKY